jgi:serine/threonine protein kinase
MRDRSGKYRLMYQLGSGGMGQVWGGVRLGREGMVMPCAIKVLHPALAQTERERQRFFNEARIAAQLDHGRIVKVTDMSEVQGSPCLVMEWVDGVNLREFTDKIGIRLELDVCLHVVGEILAALEYAHERTVAGTDAGVIHYDVTPGNILISSSGEVKLTDFGIARFSATADGTMSRSMGTPRYMSPEQMSGRARRETDIYSLGVVFHELLAGERYLDGCDRQQFQTLVLDGYVPELNRPNTPAWVDQLRRQMLANQPDDRPRAVDALSLILQKTSHYHLAGQQLRELYQRVIGERRSGLTELVDTDDVPGAYRRLCRERAPIPELERKAPRSGLSRGGTRTGLPGFEVPITATEVLEESLPDMRDESLPGVPMPATAAPERLTARRLTTGLVAVSLLLVGVGVGLLAARSGDGLEGADAPTPEQVVVAEQSKVLDAKSPAHADPKPPPRTEIATQLEPEPEPVSVPDPEPVSTAEPVSASEPGPTVQPKPAPEPKPIKKQAAKVVVTFVIVGATSARLEVGPHSIQYNQIAMLELRPGKYKVRWRESDTQPWHAAGTVRVEALAKGAYYEARVGSSSVQVVQREEGSAK